MKTEDFILLLFEKAKQAGLEEYEVYCSIGKSFFTDVNNGEPEKYTVNDFTGISFRAKKDGRIGYCSTTAKSPETADFLRLLREQTERMTQMTKTLLEMSELRAIPCTERIEIGPMAEEILTDLAPLAERNGIILESTGDGVMIGSDTLIYRMLYNLTENAIRYNRPDGTVHITITNEKNQPVIRVADTGCGIPEQYRDSIFQPFFRVDKSRSRENGGVGLGLSLVWEIVALHGGEIRVEKSSEKGTTIAVKFPAGVFTN